MTLCNTFLYLTDVSAFLGQKSEKMFDPLWSTPQNHKLKELYHSYKSWHWQELDCLVHSLMYAQLPSLSVTVCKVGDSTAFLGQPVLSAQPQPQQKTVCSYICVCSLPLILSPCYSSPGAGPCICLCWISDSSSLPSSPTNWKATQPFGVLVTK